MLLFYFLLMVLVSVIPIFISFLYCSRLIYRKKIDCILYLVSCIIFKIISLFCFLKEEVLNYACGVLDDWRDLVYTLND